MKYLCDEMLGTLAKWLRIIGYDTSYLKNMGDKELIKKAQQEGRILLTRDKELSHNCENSFYIDCKTLDEQLTSVIQRFSLKIDTDKTLTRCTSCNTQLVSIGKNEAKDNVPLFVYSNHNKFWICHSCNRIYWKGTHVDDMIARLKKLEINACST